MKVTENADRNLKALVESYTISYFIYIHNVSPRRWFVVVLVVHVSGRQLFRVSGGVVEVLKHMCGFLTFRHRASSI